MDTAELLRYLNKQKRPLIWIDLLMLILFGLAKAYSPWAWLEYIIIGVGLSMAGALVVMIDIEQKIRGKK